MKKFYWAFLFVITSCIGAKLLFNLNWSQFCGACSFISGIFSLVGMWLDDLK